MAFIPTESYIVRPIVSHDRGSNCMCGEPGVFRWRDPTSRDIAFLLSYMRSRYEYIGLTGGILAVLEAIDSFALAS